MTVESETSKIQYAGNGSTTAFSTSFVFTNNADVTVILTTSAGNEVTQTLTTNYTLTGAGTGSAGTVTMVVAPASGETLTIFRDPPITQEVDYISNDTFPAETHEGALDKLTQVCQRLSDIQSRALTLPETTSSSVSTLLPSPEASKFIGWNGAATALTNIASNDGSLEFVTSTGSSTPRTHAERWSEIRNVKDYGAKGDGVTDDSASIQAAIDSLTSGGVCFFPSGHYLLETEINIPSDVYLCGVGYASRLNKKVGSPNHFIFNNTTSGTFNNVTISDLRFTTEMISVSGTESMINIDGPSVNNFKILDCFFENTTAYCNSLFIKTQASKTVDTVIVSGNIFSSSGRMACEIINHDNATNYNAANITITDNVFNNCDLMGCSISGAIKSVVVSNNQFKDCDSIGLELVGPLGCVVNGNVFAGTFSSIISSSGGIFSDGKNISLTGNVTEGPTSGRIFLSSFGSGAITGNSFDLTGGTDSITLSGSTTNGCTITGNKFITNDTYVLICDDSPNHLISDNILDNTASSSVFATFRAINANSTGIVFKDNIVDKGTGGTHYDEQSGGQIERAEGNILDGVPEDIRVKSSRVYVGRGAVTTSGTTSTCTITFASSSSWRPNTIKIAATGNQTGSGNAGYAESHYHVRSVNSASSVEIGKNDITTSANLVLSAAYGTSTMTITATVPATGVQVLWDIHMVNWLEVDSVVFA